MFEFFFSFFVCCIKYGSELCEEFEIVWVFFVGGCQSLCVLDVVCYYGWVWFIDKDIFCMFGGKGGFSWGYVGLEEYGGFLWGGVDLVC